MAPSSSSDPFGAVRDKLEYVDASRWNRGASWRIAAENHRAMYDSAVSDMVKIAAIRSRGSDPIQESMEGWVEIMKLFLIGVTEYQRAVITNYHSPGFFNFASTSIVTETMFDVYLPGFWDCFSTNDEEFQQAFDTLKEIVSIAAPRAKQFIDELLKKHSYQAIQKLQEDSLFPNPPEGHDIFTARLFQLAAHEKTLYEGRAALHTSMNAMPNLINQLPSARKVAARLESKAAVQTLIDEFGVSALKVLNKILDPNEVNPKEVESLQELLKQLQEQGQHLPGSLDDFVGEDGEDEQDVLDEVPAHLADEGSDSIDAMIAEFDPMPEEAFIKYTIEDAFAHGELPLVWYYPRTINPSSSVVHLALSASHVEWKDEGWNDDDERRSQKPREKQAKKTSHKGSGQGRVYEFEEIEGAPLSAADRVNQRTVAKKLVRRWSGFKVGREISNKEWNEEASLSQFMESAKTIEGDRLAEKLADPVLAIQECVDSLSKTEMDLIESQAFKRAIKEFSDFTKRDEDVAKAKKDATVFHLFCPAQLFDNWYHCRCYFAIFEWACNKKGGFEPVKECEIDLIRLLSMIRVGTADPLPWILVVDFVLRRLWRSVPSEKRQSHYLRDVFTELVTFAHGTTLNAIVVRCKRQHNTPLQILKDWYPKLWQYNSRCANEDCRWLLPNPSQVRVATIRDMFSFGTKLARVGKRRFRSMVSTNRVDAFPCLYSILTNYEPNLELVVVIFWYSAVYHDRTCKSHRGKRALTSFA